MTNQNQTRKEWKKPTVKAIANVRKTRGGPGFDTLENALYSPS